MDQTEVKNENEELKKSKTKIKKNTIFRNILIIKNIKLLLLKYNNLQFILLIENERNNIFFKILK